MGQAVGDHPPRTVELEAVRLGRVDDGELPGPDQRSAAALLGGAGPGDLQIHEDVGTVGARNLPDPMRGPLRLGGDPRPHDPGVRAGLDPATKALDGTQRLRRERYESLADDLAPVPELLTRGTDRHIPHRHAAPSSIRRPRTARSRATSLTASPCHRRRSTPPPLESEMIHAATTTPDGAARAPTALRTGAELPFQAPAPPSTGTIAPVTIEARSLSSHAATSATSRGSAIRPSGMRRVDALDDARGRRLPRVDHLRRGAAGGDAVHPDALPAPRSRRRSR